MINLRSQSGIWQKSAETKTQEDNYDPWLQFTRRLERSSTSFRGESCDRYLIFSVWYLPLHPCIWLFTILSFTSHVDQQVLQFVSQDEKVGSGKSWSVGARSFRSVGKPTVFNREMNWFLANCPTFRRKSILFVSFLSGSHTSPRFFVLADVLTKICKLFFSHKPSCWSCCSSCFGCSSRLDSVVCQTDKKDNKYWWLVGRIGYGEKHFQLLWPI